MLKLIFETTRILAIALAFYAALHKGAGVHAQDKAPEQKTSETQANHSIWSGFQNAGAGPLEKEWLPSSWSPDVSTFAWQAPIEGYGQSTPVVWAERVLVTSTSGPNKEQYHLSAYNLTSGERLWKKDFSNPTPEESSTYVSRAAPSPVVDAQGVLALFEGGVLVATDFNGVVRWQRNLVADLGPIKARHGLAASLEQNESLAFVWIERSDEPYLLAVNKRTGETEWKVPGLGATSWCSPRLVPTQHGSHLVCSASGKLVGFDPLTGNRLWELAGIENNSSCTPVPCGIDRFLIGASDGRGEESSGAGAESNGVVKIARDEATGSFSADYVWRAKKATCSFGSPAVSAERAFLVNRTGVLFQLDLATGDEIAASRIKAGSVWATPIVTQEHVYLFGQKGTTSILGLASGREEQTNALWAQPTESPAVGDPAAMGSGGPVLYAAAAARPYLILRQGDMLTAIKSEK